MSRSAMNSMQPGVDGAAALKPEGRRAGVFEGAATAALDGPGRPMVSRDKPCDITGQDDIQKSSNQ
jgi:hypothetical protein